MIPLAITAAIQNACRRRNTGTSHSRKTLPARLKKDHDKMFANSKMNYLQPDPHCTHCQSPTSRRSNQSFAKECNFANAHRDNNKIYRYF